MRSSENSLSMRPPPEKERKGGGRERERERRERWVGGMEGWREARRARGRGKEERCLSSPNSILFF
jgi:hypothetical protein